MVCINGNYLNLRCDKINKIVQEGYFDKHNQKYVTLPEKIFRIKLVPNKQTGRFERALWNNGKSQQETEYEPIIYNLLDYEQAGQETPQVATVKDTSGEMVPLDVFNVHRFITRNSIAIGVIKFDSVVLSGQGISLSNSIMCLLNKTYKPRRNSIESCNKGLKLTLSVLNNNIKEEDEEDIVSDMSDMSIVSEQDNQPTV